MDDTVRLGKLLEDLTGEKAPISDGEIRGACALLRRKGGLGWSQLNEVLLIRGYDRVSSEFFQYLVDRTTDYRAGAALASFRHLERAVTDFRKLALLIFGNVKFAFKTLSGDPDVLRDWLAGLAPVDARGFRKRHAPVLPVRKITPDRTYLWGYLIEEEIKSSLRANPNDARALRMKRDREESMADGLINHRAYLASDYLDVYVATSMRQQHEFRLVHRLTTSIFSHRQLRSLKLRWFDPTQAYCPDRIDKGLAEALMLKRAKCTIYLAQESETFGKDSELASTLAQGKPVIAYVPRGGASYVEALMADLHTVYPEKSEMALLLEQLRVFNVGLAWVDPKARRWLDRPEIAPVDKLRARLRKEVKRHYDQRARTLKETHPLGIQVYLSSGVANGVLVVRTIEDCAKLVRRILTRALEFKLDEYTLDNMRYIVLREKISGCVFRVVTGDEMLTNAFWNFYLSPEN